MPQTERTPCTHQGSHRARPRLEPWALLNDIGKLWRRRADLVALTVVISPPIPGRN